MNNKYLSEKKLEKKVFRLVLKKRYDDALKLVEEERLFAKNNSIYYSLYGMIHIFLGKIYDAELYLQKALTLNPVDVYALNALAYLHLLKKSPDKAMQLYLRVLNFDPDNKIINNNIKFFKKDPLERYDKIDPNDFLIGKNIFFKVYQKISISILLILLLMIVLYNVISDNSQTTSEVKLAKDRERYYTLTNKSEVEDLVDSLRTNSSEVTNELIVTLNNLLHSNVVNIEKKIVLEHQFRRVNLDLLVEDYKNDKINIDNIINKPQLYDNIILSLKGSIKKKNTANIYTFQTDNDSYVKLNDQKQILSKININEPVSIICKTMVIDKQLIFKVIKLD
ncbi:MAG: hypothetical protein OEZ36_04920 [Spirochaetota bacterium]|nr:hypothetical protein [Spirochaetota bacterium]